MGAAAVLFPADERTRDFLRACGREADWRELNPGPDGGGEARISIALRKCRTIDAQTFALLYARLWRFGPSDSRSYGRIRGLFPKERETEEFRSFVATVLGFKRCLVLCSRIVRFGSWY